MAGMIEGSNVTAADRYLFEQLADASQTVQQDEAKLHVMALVKLADAREQLEAMQAWKDRAVAYLEEYNSLLGLMGNNSQASGLQLLLKNCNSY